MVFKVFRVSAVFILMGCTTVSKPASQILTEYDLDTFVQSITRNFETATDDKDSQILDQRVRISSPELAGEWIYTQLNTGLDKKLYRQRVSHLSLSEDRRSIIQKSYELQTPQEYVDLWNNPQKLKRITHADITPFANDGCVQKWKRDAAQSWYGKVDPQTCIINSKRRHKNIRIESQGRLSGDTYETNERGFDMEMQQIWGSPPGEFIVLYAKP